MRDRGKTIILVTHDMGAVQRFCDRALLIENGEVKTIGDPQRVGTEYVELNFGRDTGKQAAGEGERYGSQDAQVTEAWFEDEHGQRTATIPQGRPCAFKARVEFRSHMEHPAIAVLIENDRHHPLFAASTDVLNRGDTGIFAAGESAIFTVSFENAIAPGRIYASPWIVHGRGTELADRRPRMLSALVAGTHVTGGLVDLPHDVTIERSGSSAEVTA
jgi:hypothetical protein